MITLYNEHRQQIMKCFNLAIAWDVAEGVAKEEGFCRLVADGINVCMESQWYNNNEIA